MTLYFTETFEGATPSGTNLTLTNTAYDGFSNPGTSTLQSSNAVVKRGSLAMKCVSVATAPGNPYMWHTFTATTVDFEGWYMQWPSNPAATHTVGSYQDSVLGTVAEVRVTTTGGVMLRNSSQVAIGTSPNITAGSWVRCEVSINAGTATMRVWWGADVESTSTGATNFYTTSGAITNTSAARFTLGNTQSLAWTCYYDDHRADNTTWVGPTGSASVSVNVVVPLATATATAPLPTVAPSQIAYPSGDLVTTGWTKTPSGAASIATVLADVDDTTYAESRVNPQSQILVEPIGALINPGVDTGHSLKLRAEMVSATTGSLQVQLVQGPLNADGTGGTLIATRTYAQTSAWADYTMTLDAVSEASLITDYTSLHLRAYASAS